MQKTETLKFFIKQQLNLFRKKERERKFASQNSYLAFMPSLHTFAIANSHQYIAGMYVCIVYIEALD